MPTIEIELNDKELSRLQDEHRKATLAMLQSSPEAIPPDFPQWLGQILPPSYVAQEDSAELIAVRTFTAIEQFVFHLHQRGFMLASLDKTSQQQTLSLQELAQAVVADLKLQPNHVKRIQDLLTHFSKTAKELADTSTIGLTPRNQAALLEAYRLLFDRTEKAIGHLGSERAIGRVEGGAAMLVSMEIIDRDSAKKKTDEFKIKARTGTLTK